MKIIVAKEDRTSDLGAEIQQSAAARRQGRVPEIITQELSALNLLKAESEHDYLRDYIRLLRYRDAFNTFDFDIPRKPGLVGLVMAKLKMFCWKFLRFQSDRIAFKQNLINGMLTNALECEMALRDREVAELKRRIAVLERDVLRSTETPS